ncbi:MAG TPA: PadR family transcriptional regulator [Ruminococcaceae bacterium]|nr:PadR family transcriptional regulator [Oscillospiraceae bacterium]
MNELFILGELMEGPHNGYQLRQAMPLCLTRHHKLSYGVVYPLLAKLEAAGYLQPVSTGPEKEKPAMQLTDAGRARFFELMAEPVPDGAHTDEIYMIKLDAMQHLPLADQLALLATYRAEQSEIIKDAQTALTQLAVEQSRDHWYAQRKFELRLAQAQLALRWATDFGVRLQHQEDPE